MLSEREGNLSLDVPSGLIDLGHPRQKRTNRVKRRMPCFKNDGSSSKVHFCPAAVCLVAREER
jgi:hypothetical protein